MRINKSAIGKCCPTCWRKIDSSTVETFEKEKVRRIENGNKEVPKLRIKAGRPAIANEELVFSLRAKGLPLEDIAAELGISVTTVWRRLK